MKDLVEFIAENDEMKSIKDVILEGNETFVKFTLYGCDNSKETQKKIASLAQKDGIYFEETDNGFKLKIKPGQKISEIEDALNKLIEDVPEDKKEELADKTEKIKSAIDKMKEAAKEDNGE